MLCFLKLCEEVMLRDCRKKDRNKEYPFEHLTFGCITWVSCFSCFSPIGEIDQINDRSAQQGLAPIKMAARITNEEAGGIFGDVEALTFTYCMLNYGKQRDGYWDSEKMLSKQKKLSAYLNSDTQTSNLFSFLTGVAGIPSSAFRVSAFVIAPRSGRD